MARKGDRMTQSLLNSLDVAERLNVSRSYAYLLIWRGDTPTVRIGGLVRVRPEDLEEYICKRDLKMKEPLRRKRKRLTKPGPKSQTGK